MHDPPFAMGQCRVVSSVAIHRAVHTKVPAVRPGLLTVTGREPKRTEIGAWGGPWRCAEWRMGYDMRIGAWASTIDGSEPMQNDQAYFFSDVF